MTRPLDPEMPDPTPDQSEALSQRGSSSSQRGATFGAALGSAMLGLEQSLRREPPAQVLVQEHRPVRGLSGDGSLITIEFPDHIETPSARPPVDR